MKYKKSKELYKKALKSIPGGVNSPVRAFKSVGKDFPIFIEKGKKSKIYDVDGNSYIDYISSWGPLILGHNNKTVLKEVKKELYKGSSFGLPTKKEIKIAKLIKAMFPSIKKIRLCSSGTEAAMATIRLARAYTKRKKILKFEGCYHGHSDSLLVSAGSGLLTFDKQDSNGINPGVRNNTICLPYNDIKAVENLFKKIGNEIACIIVEPVAANMGLVLPEIDFLKKLREITKKYNSLLIFDEVITGFRLARGGAQEIYDIKPDLTVLGKIIGGGYPIGAFGGKNKIMKKLSPEGGVYHAGTLSGNPISVTAGLKTLKILNNSSEIYTKLNKNTEYLVKEMKKLAKKYNENIQINHIGSLFTIFFYDKKVKNMEDAKLSCSKKYNLYFNTMLENGIMPPPSKFEAHFLGISHSKGDFEKTLKVFEKFLKKLKDLSGNFYK